MQFRVYKFDHPWNTRYKPGHVALPCRNLVKTNQQVSKIIYIFPPTLRVYFQIQRLGKSWLYVYFLWSLPCVHITERIHIYFGVIAHVRFNANNIFVNICVKKMEFDTEEAWLMRISLGSLCFLHAVYHNE